MLKQIKKGEVQKMKELAAMFLKLLMVFTFTLSAHAFVITKPLAADKAFSLSITQENPNKVILNWEMAEGYYLYRQKLHFNFDPKATAEISFPQAEMKQDLNHGQYEVYSGKVSIPMILRSSTDKVKMTVDYQGCSAKGFCYPPMQQTSTLTVTPDTGKSSSYTSLLTDQNSVKALLGSSSMLGLLMIFGALGLLLAFTPCILPMIPILTSIIVGHKQPVSTRKAFFLSTTYVLGSSITYAFVGLLAAYMGSSLQASLQQPWIIAIVSAFFVLLSLSLFNVYDLHLPRSWQNYITAISRKQEGGTYIGVFIMGVISTLVVSPCVTAPLIGILMYIAESGNMALGAGALFLMGLGMGIPLIAIGVTTGKWMPRRGPWMTVIQQIFGVMMIAMAIWLLSRVASLAIIMMFTAVVLFGAAFLFAVRQHRFYALDSAIAGILLVIAINSPTVMQTVSSPAVKTSFTIVKNMDELNQQLSQSKGLPVLLDFYADWCESCIIMDKKVFDQEEVKKSLNKFVLLRVDISHNSAADATLLKSFGVIAPPTILFFNNYGQEVNSKRIVGELNANEFLGRIDTFITASCDKNQTC